MSQIDFISGVPFNSTHALREIAKSLSKEYVLLYTKPFPLEMGMYAEERILSIAKDTDADMLYADHYKLVTGQDGKEVRKKHPLIDCQKGALRDDFDFGSVLVFRTGSFVEAVSQMNEDYQWGALYDLRLRMTDPCSIYLLF